jgi:hypothetical protein
MQRDEKRKPDAEYEQGDKEVTVCENGSGLLGNLHRYRVDSCGAG